MHYKHSRPFNSQDKKDEKGTNKAKKKKKKGEDIALHPWGVPHSLRGNLGASCQGTPQGGFFKLRMKEKEKKQDP